MMRWCFLLKKNKMRELPFQRQRQFYEGRNSITSCLFDPTHSEPQN